MIFVPFLLFNSWQGTNSESAQRINNDAIGKLEAFDFSAAVADFKAALALCPTSLVIRVNLGLAYFYLGNFDEADQQLEYVLNQDCRDPYAHFLRGVMADRKGRTDKAVNHFHMVLELVPNDPGTYYHLGLIELRGEKPEQAVSLFKRSLAGNPECTSTLYNLGRALLLTGERAEGEAILQKFSRLQSHKQPGPGGGMGDPSLLVGAFGQPRKLFKK